MNIDNIENLKTIIDFLKTNKQNIKLLIDSFGKVESINNYGAVFIRSSGGISKTVINTSNNLIKSVSFYGEINIQFQDLIDNFHVYREVYSPHDNLYFYFFNENVPSNFVVSCFSDFRIKENSELYLKNIQIKLKD